MTLSAMKGYESSKVQFDVFQYFSDNSLRKRQAIEHYENGEKRDTGFDQLVHKHRKLASQIKFVPTEKLALAAYIATYL